MRDITDEFLLHVAEYSATMIGLFLVGVFFYMETGLRRWGNAREVFEPYLRAGVRIVLIVFAIPLGLALTLVALEPVWSRVTFALLSVALIVAGVDTAAKVRAAYRVTGSTTLLVNEIVGTIVAPVIVATPWVLGGLYPNRENLTWALLLSFAIGFLSVGSLVLSAFDVGRLEVANSTGGRPLQSTVDDLLSRLDDILDGQGHAQLGPDWDHRRPADWSSTHDYFMSSSVYLFARYVAQVEILRDRLAADRRAAARQSPLLAAVDGTATALSAWPAPYNEAGCSGGDSQVLAWQQRVLGEAITRWDGDAGRVMTYADFLSDADRLAPHTRPVHQLLLDISPEPAENCRWQRLGSVRAALVKVREQCEALHSS